MSSRRTRVGWILLLAAGAAVGLLLPTVDGASGGGSGEVRFIAPEWLSNPTYHGITVSLIPAQAAEIYVEYGLAGHRRRKRTPPITVAGGRLASLRIDGLKAGREYDYTVRCRVTGLLRGAMASGPFEARGIHRFRTLRKPGARSFSFGFATDSHTYGRWVQAQCNNNPRPFQFLKRTIDNLTEEDLDFVILGGDEVMLQGQKGPHCDIDGEDAGPATVVTARQAELRYRLFRRVFGSAAGGLPVFFVLGNHDGESGFWIPRENCDMPKGTRALSENARLAFLPNPAAVYAGAPAGNYFAFESGDALFVILDVMRYTNVAPASPEDWTLGEEQKRWLESTLLGSRRKWKFVFAHHLVGGLPHKNSNCYAYGRGGVFSTVDGTPRGAFLGEQREINELMKRAGAQFFIYGHDHLFAHREKLDAEGSSEHVHYVCGGVSSGKGAAWHTRSWGMSRSLLVFA